MKKRLTSKSRARDRKKKQLNSFKKKQYYIKDILDNIRKWDDPVLYQISEEVKKEEDVSEVIKDMKKTLYYSKNGVGLAACQIGVLKKIVLVKLDNKNPTIFINPEIIEKSEETIKSNEGCLSYPGINSIVNRCKNIKVKYENEERKICEGEFEEMNGIIIQHEVDHTIGVCVVGNAWKEQKIE